MHSQNTPLPQNWEARYDPAQRRYFYINHITKATQWEDPRFQKRSLTPSAAVSSQSPSRNAARSSSYQMQEMQSPERLTLTEEQESNFSAEIDQALVAKLHSEFTKASKELIIDMLASCYNNERQTREQLQGFGFGKDVSLSRQAHPPKQESQPELSEAEKNRIHSQLAHLFPSLSAQEISASAKVAKYDVQKIKILIQHYIDTEKTSNKAGGSSSSSSATSSASLSVRPPTASFEPAGMDEAASNQAQGLGATTSSAATNSASSSRSRARSNISDHHSMSARQVTNKPRKNVPPKKHVVTKQPQHEGSPAQRLATSQRSNALGPDPGLCQGPDASLLSNDLVQAAGPDFSLRNGPDRSLCSGPDPSRVNGPIGATGPDSSIRCGPQAALRGSATQLLITNM